MRKNILIVDDEKNFATILGRRLEYAGYNVYVADSAEKAYKLALLKNISLITTDINMPKMDGYEFCRKLRSHQKLRKIPIIILSGNDDNTHRQKAIICGAVEYLTKPFDPIKLENCLSKLLRQ